MDAGGIAEVVRLIDSCDVVCSETPEAVIFSYIMRKRGLPGKPFIVSEVDLLERAKKVAGWIEKAYGENPLEEFLRSETNFWIITTLSHRDRCLDAGIPADNLFYIPSSVFQMRAFFPQTEGLFSNGAPGGGPVPVGILKSLHGKIICPGVNRRDFLTLASAAELSGAEVFVITDLAKRKRIRSPFVHFLDMLPLEEYVAAIRNSKFVVVPLFNTPYSGGQQTPVVAMYFGKVVVASRVDATVDYIEDNVSGLLVEPENPPALAKAIRRADGSNELRGRIGAAAASREREISELAERRYEKMFDLAYRTGRKTK
ncbi:MAG: glycosyltransferase [bacterium]